MRAQKFWRYVSQSYGLKLDDVDAVLKALVKGVAGRSVQYLEVNLCTAGSLGECVCDFVCIHGWAQYWQGDYLDRSDLHAFIYVLLYVLYFLVILL
ncbi:hypothetical protein Y032_0023g766 [Ancylostoma ceylanicum]|uniref:Uncharacterized protein n=1 Tax=Ancylostoma ceylanicum TaxID=53326 RepID=A0A016UWS6_9BILA|nr:hypothetical protein Y032_0023g766 [Ancylostoma ceylanicum]